MTDTPTATAEDTARDVAYDSRPATREHIAAVAALLDLARDDLYARREIHDASKLVSPEVEVFDVATPKLATLTYGSDEYKASLDEMKPALEHHYAANDHHPEHFENGVRDMNAMQVIEMCCDWIAAARRHKDADPRQVLKSLNHNSERFGYGHEFHALVVHTIHALLDAETAA